MSTNEILLKEMEQIENYSRDCYNSYNHIWEKVLEDHQRKVSGVTFTSELDFVLELGNLILERNVYGEKYNVLIEELDRKGKELLAKGAGTDIIKKMSYLMDEIISESSSLDIEVNVAGDAYGNYVDGKLGDTMFEVSSFSKYTKEWWNDKFYSTPEGKEILRKRIEKEEQQHKKAVEKQQSKAKEALMFLLNEKYEKDMAQVITLVNELSSKIENSKLEVLELNEKLVKLEDDKETKNNIIEAYFSEMVESSKVKMKNTKVDIEEYKKKIASLKIEDDQIKKEIKELSLFDLKEKKKLQEKKRIIENELSQCLININNLESELRGLIGEKYSLITEEQQSVAIITDQITSIKEKLNDLNIKIHEDTSDYNKYCEVLKNEREKIMEQVEKDASDLTGDEAAKNICLKKDIYLFFRDEISIPITVNECRTLNSGDVATLSNLQLSALMNQLVKMGLLTKTEKEKKLYFSI